MNRIIKTVMIFFASLLVLSCKKKEIPHIVIWTDNIEFMSYVEHFNSTHKDLKAVVVYKKEVAKFLPVAKDEIQPDIVVGSWLMNSNVRKNFEPVDFFFKESKLSLLDFYNQLLEYGKMNNRQYLLPVSFNLPAMVFNKKNETLVGTDHFLTLDQVKLTSAGLNNKTDKNVYTSMGYGPSWDSDFLYLVSKLNGAAYHEKGSSFMCDEEAISKTITQIKDWTIARNTDTSSEQNFQFRYLYMPKYNQVTSGRCLYAFLTSDEIFTLTKAQSSSLSFRWIIQNEKIPVEDNLVTMGIYKEAENPRIAEKFIEWFMNEDTQKQLIERTENMKLNTTNFGIAGGFSSLKQVNEKNYPAFYRELFGNLPPENYICVPNILPARWESILSNVIKPYLADSTKTDAVSVKSLRERISEWEKQRY